jgi:hypothetical protein
VSIVISKMLKRSIVIVAMVVSGCATQSPAGTGLKQADMQTFRPNCKIAQIQIDNLNRNITDYLEYFKTHTTTLEDRRYFGKLKNNIWSLRSSCFENSR